MANDETNTDPYQLARALLNNGDALIEDAELLLDHRRYPRAAALALMALEELSKVHLCLEAIINQTPVPEARSKAWTDHKGKFEGARALELAFLDEAPDLDRADVQESIARDQRTKLACLYVDHFRGQIHTPSEVRANATHLLERAQSSSSMLSPVVVLLTPDVMEEIRPYREEFDQYFASMVNEDDIGATVGRFRTVMEQALSATKERRPDEPSPESRPGHLS